MSFPSVLFALVIALLYGAIYHLVRGGRFGRLILYFVLSSLGFMIGHLIGLWRNWVFIPLGPLNLGLSSLGSICVLLLGDWLSRTDGKERRKV